jgi:hypothetical protein
MAEPIYHRIETHHVFEDGTEALVGVQFLLPSGQSVCEKDGRLEVQTNQGTVRLAPDVLAKIKADPRQPVEPAR